MRQVGKQVLQKVTRLNHWLLQLKMDQERRRNLILKRWTTCFRLGTTTGLRRGLVIRVRLIGWQTAQWELTVLVSTKQITTIGRMRGLVTHPRLIGSPIVPWKHTELISFKQATTTGRMKD